MDDPILESLTNALNESRQDQENLKNSIAESKALMKLLKEIVEIMGFKLRWKHIDARENRDKILESITTAMKSATRDACLETLEKRKTWLWASRN